jgi:hypothetical protein
VCGGKLSVHMKAVSLYRLLMKHGRLHLRAMDDLKQEVQNAIYRTKRSIA